jgi:hypothetical protein
MSDMTTAEQANLVQQEIESFVKEWYRKIDEHVPVEELLPMVHPDTEFHIPEGVSHGYDGLRELYQGENGWIRSFFDVHTVRQITVSSTGRLAAVDVVVNWQARRWRPPVPRSQWLGFDAYQQWEITRSPETGMPLINRYVVNELRPMPGSPSL